MPVQEQRCAIYPLSSTPTLRLWAIKITRSLIIELVLTHARAHTQKGRRTVASHNIGSRLLMARGGSGVTYFLLKGGEEEEEKKAIRWRGVYCCPDPPREEMAGHTFGACPITGADKAEHGTATEPCHCGALRLRVSDWHAAPPQKPFHHKMTHLKCSGGKKERKKALSASTLWKKNIYVYAYEWLVHLAHEHIHCCDMK